MIVVLALLEPGLSKPQAIILRHPETSQLSGELERIHGRVPELRSKFIARPGNVIVHFDKQREIQQLQYVLQDGKLATLFQRHPQHPSNGPIPIQVQRSFGEQVYRRDDPPGSSLASGVGGEESVKAQPQSQPHRIIDHDQTIDIVDAKLQGVSQLVGNHITFELPNLSHETNSSYSGPNIDHKVDILATVARDAIQTGAQIGEAKLKKAGTMLNGLKKKVSQKLHELPRIIGDNLRSKSSVGQVFLDHVGRKIIIVADANSVNRSESSANHVQQVPVETQSVQFHPQQIPVQPVQIEATKQQVYPHQVVPQKSSQHELGANLQAMQLSPQHLTNRR